ncbi:MAG: NAD(P)H-binding protein [Leptospira sp.]|nr:NAD(P)H-binding protein [Leptospira sp.]
MKILLLGGTGLIGKQVLLSLVFYPQVKKTILWARVEKTDSNPNVPIELVHVSFESFKAGKVQVPDGLDAVICCLGTTIKVAGSEEKFREIDYEYPLLVAKQAKAKKVKTFLIVTAMGSDPNSSLFYNRVKGEIERDLSSLEFPYLGIFRPSLLLGDRKEIRVGEKIGEIISAIIPFGLLGLNRFKPILAEFVARSMVKTLLGEASEMHKISVVKIFENDELWELGKNH